MELRRGGREEDKEVVVLSKEPPKVEGSLEAPRRGELLFRDNLSRLFIDSCGDGDLKRMQSREHRCEEDQGL